MSELKIPQGYKQTEVGVIPEDWGVYSLPDVIWYQEGPGLRNWQFKSKGLKVINVTNLQENGWLDLDKTDRHISWSEFEKTYKHFACDNGDLVIASSGNSYCKASIVRECDLPLLMNTSVIRFKPIGIFSKGYMEVYLKSQYFKNQIDLLITGGAQPNFGPAHLNQIKIPAPIEEKEQTLIATALSDVDNLISELEKLITKKQAIKTATMQQLLTGKTRLPQFALRDDGTRKGYKQSELGEIPEDWDVKPLSELVEICSGESPSKFQFLSEGIPYFKVEQLNNDLVYADETPYYIETSRVISAGSIIFPKRGASILSNKIRVLKRDSFMDTNLMTLSCSPELDEIYLLSQLTYHGLDSIADTTSIPQINNKHINPYLVPFTGKQEQLAIATILSVMHEEINVLEKRLNKTRQIKQGMMQELLTGKTRLLQGTVNT